MKKYINQVLILFGYCVPYAFFAIYGDAQLHTMIFYGFMLLAIFLLLHLSLKLKNKRLVVVGNVLSFLSSYACTSIFFTDNMGWYFKPFTSNSFLILISILILMIQLVFIFPSKQKHK